MLVRDNRVRGIVNRGHRHSAVAELRDPTGVIAEAPVTSGSLAMSLSNSTGLRSGTIGVPGYDWWPLLNPGTAAWVAITILVDDDPFSMGEFPILKASLERPGGLVTCILGDWAFRAARHSSQAAEDIPVQTYASAVGSLLSRSMPVPLTVVADDTGGASMASLYRLSLGGSMWRAATDIANQAGCIVVMEDRASFSLRNFDLVAPVPVENLDGTISKQVLSVDAESATNQITVTVEDDERNTFRAVRYLSTGPYRWGADFGYAPTVQTFRVPVASQALADAEASRLAKRRMGVVRSLGLSIVPMPWLQPGDVVEATTGQDADSADIVEVAQIESITYPLTARDAMSISTRDRWQTVAIEEAVPLP